MKWGTRYAHYTTIKRAIILYYAHYIALIRLWRKWIICTTITIIYDFSYHAHYIAIIRLWMKWIFCTTITIIYDFSYYAHYVAIIYIIHIISLTYGYLYYYALTQSCSIVLTKNAGRHVRTTSERQWLVAAGIRTWCSNRRSVSSMTVHGTSWSKLAVAMTALESQRYSCIGLRTFPSSNTSLHTVAGERVTDNRRW